ncbi:hypothetical protein E2C01_096233 [Portunus trituberculatus]|uniref:Uncharacterized protein n=1 Tax=Portunus trituberculatus TaxID=210409 RepID=A0A5B7K6D2_PORTR|nr:hypothetical protein [Portunus trituberculatus]
MPSILRECDMGFKGRVGSHSSRAAEIKTQEGRQRHHVCEVTIKWLQDLLSRNPRPPLSLISLE